MVNSNTEPSIIEIDKIRNGKARILVRWNIQESQREEESGELITTYYYDECRMDWVLPQAYESRTEIEAYLATIQDEILDWAKGSTINL